MFSFASSLMFSPSSSFSVGTRDCWPKAERPAKSRIAVRIVEPETGRRLFRSEQSCRLDPDGAPVTLVLERERTETCSRGSRLQVQVRDADNDALLDRCEVELKIDLEEWD